MLKQWFSLYCTCFNIQNPEKKGAAIDLNGYSGFDVFREGGDRAEEARTHAHARTHPEAIYL